MSIFLFICIFSNCFSTINGFASFYLPNLPPRQRNNSFYSSAHTNNPFLKNNDQISVAYFNLNDSEPPIEVSPHDFSVSKERIQDNNAELRISERMCKIFQDLSSTQQLVYHPTGTEDISKIILKRPKDSKWQSQATPLVSGGVEASPNEFPNLVALGSLTNDKKFILHCAGTLIDPKWIMTAAHCTQLTSGKLTVARLGIHRLSFLNHGKTVGIKRIIRHPSYKPPQMYFDIALMEMESFVGFSRSIRPACLDQDFSDAPEAAWVAGWGSMEFAGPVSDVLQKAQVQLINNIWCSSRYNQSPGIPRGVVPSMMCAGSPEDNWRRDTCQGDSGGPLQVPAVDFSLFKVIGITSFGVGCGLVETPGVYTRVSHFIQWIEDIVWPQRINSTRFSD